MGAKKATPFRKQTVLPEETALERAKEWAAQNMKVAIGVGVAIVLVALVAGGIVLHERSRSASAQARYALIVSRLPARGAPVTAEDWKKLLPELRNFVVRFGGTPSALDARMQLARGYFETRNYTEAVNAARGALSAASSESSLKPLILYQLAQALEAAGKPEEAAKEWKALQKLGAPAFEREAYWNLGRMLQKKKQLPKAEEMYELALQAPGGYPSAPQIDARLSAIKTAKTK
ncbi:MAG: tetratricopeptide repeat protein [Syntrophobacteraceae bacterium]